MIGRAVRRGDFSVEGTVRTHSVSLRLGFSSDGFGYLIDLGLPPQSRESSTIFKLDPEIKRECVWHGLQLRPATLLVDRRGPLVKIRSEHGEWKIVAGSLATYDSMMTHIADARNAPELLTLRETIRAWRFYDHFRTDADAPARTAQVGTRTPVLNHDGTDLAAAIETIREIGDSDELAMTVSDAFPKCSLSVRTDDAGRFTLVMQQHGLLRPLATAELSDGTLRYLLLIAALLTPRPPELMVLNEPETSLHPTLLSPLARLIARVSERSQLVVVTHSTPLISALQAQTGCNSVVLEKSFGETGITGARDLKTPAWHWPGR